MKISVHANYKGSKRQIELNVLPEETIRNIRMRACASMSIPELHTQMILGSEPLTDDLTVAQSGINDTSQITLKARKETEPMIGPSRYLSERDFVRHQFPLWTPINDPPTIYEGMLRCEEGPVKELAENKVWPFTEYVQWHRVRMELPPDYPIKPPIVTWLTAISHPNIVPNIPTAVCVSVLGKSWKPELKTPAVINALSYLLVDPNPDSVFDHPNSLKAADECKKHGFPHKGNRLGDDTKPNDTVHFNLPPPVPPDEGDLVKFNVVPVPDFPNSSKEKPNDTVHFKVFKNKSAKE